MNSSTTLRIEYAEPPFDLNDIRRVASRPDTCTWAATDSPPAGEGLTLGTTDGDSLRLAIDGFQFPNAEDQEKRFSWYIVEGSGHARRPRLGLSVAGPHVQHSAADLRLAIPTRQLGRARSHDRARRKDHGSSSPTSSFRASNGITAER